MTLTRSLVPALLVSLLAFSSASALPFSSKAINQTVETPLLQAQYSQNQRRHRSESRHRSYGHYYYRPGGRYRSAPYGWRRHGARPRHWQTQGCIMVGPVWFCP